MDDPHEPILRLLAIPKEHYREVADALAIIGELMATIATDA